MHRIFSWEKKGVVFRAEDHLPWAKSHSQMPTVATRRTDDEGDVEVFFSSRDQHNQSHIGRFRLADQDLQKVAAVQSHVVLGLGELGCFDDCGVMPTSHIHYKGNDYLYYIGWNVRNTIPYHNSLGLAVSEDGGHTYQRLHTGPIMERTHEEPHFCATACVRLENGIWRNWYLSCTEWRMWNGKPEPRYHLKYAESIDGIHWRRFGVVAIDFKDEEEGAIARATVLKSGELYQMWFCYRKWKDYTTDLHASYRIGYAESDDGLVWRRHDDLAGIAVSEQGWDAFMQAYPEVFLHRGETYMLYNGDGFGRSGIGLAQLRTAGI